MKVAHHDLKPDNIIANSMDILEVVDLEFLHVKLLDFSISKVEVKNTQVYTRRSTLRTVGYIVDALKAHVFTFGMLCSEIILGSQPFGDIYYYSTYQETIEKSKRLNLPKSCPKELKLLIENCWLLDPLKSPTFFEIYASHIFLKFEATYFINDLKDGQCRLMLKNKLEDLHKQPQVYSLQEGHDILKHVRKIKKVLINLHDVRSNNQLDKLLDIYKFKDDNGSKLITTSRTWSSLEPHILEYHIAIKIVNAYGGLPLSLEEQTLYRLLLARYDGSRDEKIWNTLQISFEDLELDEKNMFLDVSCFFFFCNDSYHGWIFEEELLCILNDDVRISKQALDNLKDKSLLMIDDFGNLYMHDQLHDIGHLYLKNCTKLKELTTDLCSMAFLVAIHLKNCTILEVLLNEWTSLKAIIELIIIKCFSLKTISNGIESLICLKKLWISECEALEEFPSRLLNLALEEFPSRLPNLVALEELNFSKYRNFKKLLKGFESLALEEFLSKLSNLVALEELNISMYRNLKKLPKGFRSLTCFKKLDKNECEALEEILSGLPNLVTLEELDFSMCKNLKKLLEGEYEALEEFLSGLPNLVTLEELNFLKCRNFKKLLEGFGSLTCLKKLDMNEYEALEEFLKELVFVKYRNLKKLREGFEDLTYLKKLCMWECKALEEFPNGLPNLIALEELNFSKCRNLKKLLEGFESLTCLKKLFIKECEALEEFPSRLPNLVALEELNFSKYRNLKKLQELFKSLICLKKLYM
uniref:Protein kinase domain-containing protein n=1 Tax=Physcomitrium patens TaxID=3218 RepID=A0A2K1IGH9_PHYPA|nr:hypothetical protein PHYPA_028974 [Physcomitrium patens]